MSNEADQQDSGLFKKPLKGSVKRVSERMAEEMGEKSPGEAVRDDVSPRPEPTEEEQANLDREVEQKHSSQES